MLPLCPGTFLPAPGCLQAADGTERQARHSSPRGHRASTKCPSPTGLHVFILPSSPNLDSYTKGNVGDCDPTPASVLTRQVMGGGGGPQRAQEAELARASELHLGNPDANRQWVSLLCKSFGRTQPNTGEVSKSVCPCAVHTCASTHTHRVTRSFPIF